MSTPSDGRPEGSGLPPHLDPRGPRRPAVPRVTESYREGARGPAPRRPIPAAPPKRRRTGRARFGRVLSWIALSLSILILGLAGVGWALIEHYNGNIQRIDVFHHHIGKVLAKAPHNAENVLLVGSDSRTGANGRGTGGAALTGGSQRSDTVILAHLYGSSDKALFVSFPRDSWVLIPAYTDPKTQHTTPAHHAKINSAITEGGPALLIATIENLTGIRVDHYVQIDFVGFKSMVNKLGGVDVCLKQSVDDAKSKLHLSAGRHHIDGKTALAFVRDRHSFASGDIQRIKNQQQLIGSIIKKVLSAGTLFNPFKLNDFLDAATSSLEVDEKFTLGDMKDLALRVRGFNSGHVLFTTVPVANSNGFIAGQSVVELDAAADATFFSSLRRDIAPVTATPKKSVPLTVRPSAIRVRVYNGSSTPGLGRKAFNDLGNLGFVTVGTPSNRGTGATQTTVYYGPDRFDSARTLAAALPGSVLQEDPTLQHTLEVVVGSTYSGATAVTVTGTPSASASPTSTIHTAADDPCAG